MPQLKAKLGIWELPHSHMWKDRESQFKVPHIPLIGKDTRVAIIGNCFAQELVDAMKCLKFNANMHPSGFFYSTKSIRQEIDRISGGWPQETTERFWEVAKGYVNPFHNYFRVYPTLEGLKQKEKERELKAADFFSKADVVVIALGNIETWLQPRTGDYYPMIPHPEAFVQVGAEFHRLTVSDLIDDLIAVREKIRRMTSAPIILSVPPIPLHSTMTNMDIRIASFESKSRVRTAYSTIVDTFEDVYYFHSYELVAAAERPGEFTKEDGRHLSRRAINHIVRNFFVVFGESSEVVPELDDNWLTAPNKAASILMPGFSLAALHSKLPFFLKRLISRVTPEWAKRLAHR